LTAWADFRFKASVPVNPRIRLTLFLGFAFIAGCATPPPKNSSSPPKLISCRAAVYPADLKRAGITGEAVVDFVVTANGDVVSPVVFSATNPEFGQAAVAAISEWKFTPAVLDGRAVNVRMRQPFRFTLDYNKPYVLAPWIGLGIVAPGHAPGSGPGRR
jgi:TonB family protein